MDAATGPPSWAYFYFMKDEPERIRATAPEHARYWSKAEPSERGGPFADHSGGLIVFECRDEERAEATIANDPFRVAELLDRWWLKQWEPVDRVQAQ